MVLGAFGTPVEESTIEAEAQMETTGTEIGELERLARQFGLIADIQEVPVEQLQALFAEDKLARIEWHFRPYLLPAGQFTKCDPPWQLGLIGWQIVPALCGLRTPLDFGLHLRNASPRAPSP